MEAGLTSETLVYYHYTLRQNIEDQDIKKKNFKK
jgi:hypothetical protein